MTTDLKWGSMVQENVHGMGTSFFATFCYNQLHVHTLPEAWRPLVQYFLLWVVKFGLSVPLLHTPPFPPPTSNSKTEEMSFCSQSDITWPQASTTVPSWSHLHRRTPGRSQGWWGRWRCFLPSPVHRLPIRSIKDSQWNTSQDRGYGSSQVHHMKLSYKNIALNGTETATNVMSVSWDVFVLESTF